jgi:hypothetical protein
MPIHDWTRLEAGDFHHFHQGWVVNLTNALNSGLQPPEYMAMTEQVTGRPNSFARLRWEHRTDPQLYKAVKKAVEEEDAKRPPAEKIRGLIEAGIIDEHGRVFSESLAMVQDLLRAKGFSGVSAFHRGDVPGGAVRLHEKTADGREAEGPYEKIRAIVKKARNHEGLWKSLATAGYARKLGASEKKKTG